MTNRKTINPHPSDGPMQLNIVNSSRLQALRNKGSLAEHGKELEQGLEKSPFKKPQQDAECARLQQQIDLRLREILAQLPINKQRSFFKIRYGVNLEDLKNLPLKRVAEILKINPVR